jgi:hypothetical protein
MYVVSLLLIDDVANTSASASVEASGDELSIKKKSKKVDQNGEPVKKKKKSKKNKVEPAPESSADPLPIRGWLEPGSAQLMVDSSAEADEDTTSESASTSKASDKAKKKGKKNKTKKAKHNQVSPLALVEASSSTA